MLSRPSDGGIGRATDNADCGRVRSAASVRVKSGIGITEVKSMGIGDLRFLFSRGGREGSPRGVPTGTHRRAAERHAVDGLQSTLGAVQDLSRSGMRVWTTRKPRYGAGTSIPLVLADGDQRMDVLATVMWVRPNEDGTGWQIGLHFEGLEPVHRAAIDTYVKAGYFTTDPKVRRSLHQPDPSFEEPSRPAAAGSGAGEAHLSAEVVNLYSMLGVEINATIEEIHRAYRQMARECHPDRSSEAGASERFTRLTKAYAVLRDERLRSKYDRVLRPEG